MVTAPSVGSRGTGARAEFLRDALVAFAPALGHLIVAWAVLGRASLG